MSNDELILTKIRLERTVSAAYHAMLEFSAWMGIPESKRHEKIAFLMENIKWCAENNTPEDMFAQDQTNAGEK